MCNSYSNGSVFFLGLKFLCVAFRYLPLRVLPDQSGSFGSFCSSLLLAKRQRSLQPSTRLAMPLKIIFGTTAAAAQGGGNTMPCLNVGLHEAGDVLVTSFGRNAQIVWAVCCADSSHPIYRLCAQRARACAALTLTLCHWAGSRCQALRRNLLLAMTLRCGMFHP